MSYPPTSQERPEATVAAFAPPPGEDYWVFGYGSLMWNPGFAYRRAAPALLRGYHRAFCIYSYRYRGTRQAPGVVLGLVRGGSCRGRAFLVAAADGQAVAGYLHAREMITGVYAPRWLPVRAEGATVRAIAYLADPAHPQFTGALDDDRLVALILQGNGQSGSNLDYLANTVRHIDELGIGDSFLHRILRRVEAALARST